MIEESSKQTATHDDSVTGVTLADLDSEPTPDHVRRAVAAWKEQHGGSLRNARNALRMRLLAIRRAHGEATEADLEAFIAGEVDAATSARVENTIERVRRDFRTVEVVRPSGIRTLNLASGEEREGVIIGSERRSNAELPDIEVAEVALDRLRQERQTRERAEKARAAADRELKQALESFMDADPVNRAFVEVWAALASSQDLGRRFAAKYLANQAGGGVFPKRGRLNWVVLPRAFKLVTGFDVETEHDYRPTWTRARGLRALLSPEQPRSEK